MEEITQLYKEFRTLDGVGVCKVYFINGIPFSFDEEEVPDNLADVVKAEEKPHFTNEDLYKGCLLYTSPSPRDNRVSRMPSSA